jgi:hypothetical protein
MLRHDKQQTTAPANVKQIEAQGKYLDAIKIVVMQPRSGGINGSRVGFRVGKATSAVTVSGLSILIMTWKKQTALEDIGSRS